MRTLDRYILRAVIGPFGFFALVFTGILWLLQALRLIETVIDSGQSMSIFVEFSTLLLPNVMIFVLPLSAFAAAVYTINHLYAESEIIVLLGAGMSPWAIARPIIIFGCLIGILTAIVTLYLYPVSATKLNDRLREVRSDMSTSLLKAGIFHHPMDGVTLFIRNQNNAGQMTGIFINDSRSEREEVTYIAERASLIGDSVQAQLVMLDGEAQRLRPDGSFSQVRFDRLAYDITYLLSKDLRRTRSAREYFVSEAFAPTPQMLADHSLGRLHSEAHEKLVLPLLAALLPVVALATIMSGSYRRGGRGWQIGLAVGLLVGIEAVQLAGKSMVKSDPALWPAAYLSILLGLLIVFGLFAGKPSRKIKIRRHP